LRAFVVFQDVVFALVTAGVREKPFKADMSRDSPLFWVRRAGDTQECGVVDFVREVGLCVFGWSRELGREGG